MTFAAHAMLGCGVHHFCEHRARANEPAAHDCSLHGCVPDDHETPDDHHRYPGNPCHHAACSFVKADTVRIDDCDEVSRPIAVTIEIDSLSVLPQREFYLQVAGTAHLDSAHLYVWHCALLI